MKLYTKTHTDFDLSLHLFHCDKLAMGSVLSYSSQWNFEKLMTLTKTKFPTCIECNCKIMKLLLK